MWRQTVRITFAGVMVWSAFHATRPVAGEAGAAVVLQEK